MPSRRVVALIVLFWFAVTGFVVYRDVWPILYASGPPPIAIDLADEAAQTIPIRWQIYRGDQKVGRLLTLTKYVDTDDTFRFTNEYKHLRLESSGIVVVVPELTTIIRVSREGDLREQSAEGKLELHLGGVKFDATAKVTGTVVDGRLVANCDVQSPIGNLKKTLEPVAIPQGQPLNPLQPVSRIRGIRPGRTWVVEESDPLGEAIGALIREKLGQYGLKLPEQKRGPLIGSVLSEAQMLNWHDQSMLCWVIEYRRDEVEARTWVRVSDGKVLKQEAFHQGEFLTVERDP